MENEWSGPGQAARETRVPWGVAEILALSLVGAFAMVVAANVAGGLVYATIPSQESGLGPWYGVFLATDWVTPYAGLLPLAAVGLAWWRLRPDAGFGEEGETAHRSRATRVAAVAAVALLFLAVGAFLSAISSLVLDQQTGAATSEIWQAEAPRLGLLAAAAVIATAGMAAALALRRRVPAAAAEERPDAVDDQATAEPGEEGRGEPSAVSEAQPDEPEEVSDPA